MSELRIACLFVVVWGLADPVVYSRAYDEEYLTNFNRVMIQHRSLVLEQMAKEQWCSRIGTAEWVEVTERPVCFGARNNMFGTFQLPAEGFLAGLKLEHARGQVTCDKPARRPYTKWGCWTAVESKGVMNVIVTTHRNRVLFPQQRFVTDNTTMWYDMPGCDPNSQEVTFENRFNPTYVTSGQKLRLWFGEDLTKKDEGNSGSTCAHVFAWYL